MKRAVRLRSPGPATALLEGRGIPADENFLEKIFQVSVYLPPLYYENLASYAKKVISGTALHSLPSETQDLTLSYLIHPEIATPRQVKAILNEFILTFAQAQERENQPDTHLAHDPLTGDPALIAKFVVLRAHFPWFYDLLRFDPQLMALWPEAYDLQAAGDPLNDDANRTIKTVRDAAAAAATESIAYASASEGNMPVEDVTSGTDRLLFALRGYMSRTADVVTTDAARVQEFVFLRSREIFAGLTGTAGSAYRRGIANGDVRLLDAALIQDPSQAVAATNLAIEQSASGFGIERLRAEQSLAFLITRLDAQQIEAVGPAAATVLFG